MAPSPELGQPKAPDKKDNKININDSTVNDSGSNNQIKVDHQEQQQQQPSVSSTDEKSATV